MWVQWVCSREQRIVLYKRSSITQSSAPSAQLSSAPSAQLSSAPSAQLSSAQSAYRKNKHPGTLHTRFRATQKYHLKTAWACLHYSGMGNKCLTVSSFLLLGHTFDILWFQFQNIVAVLYHLIPLGQPQVCKTCTEHYRHRQAIARSPHTHWYIKSPEWPIKEWSSLVLHGR